jgi:uncharacterized membrane protein YjdF
MPGDNRSANALAAASAVMLAGLLISGIRPFDRTTWVLEVFPVVIALAVMWATFRRFPLTNHVRSRAMLSFILVCIALAISAAYELIEWASALALGQGADEFLGTQGDPWDTQSDMFCALVGSVSALALMSRLHDRAIAKLGLPARQPPLAPSARLPGS